MPEKPFIRHQNTIYRKPNILQLAPTNRLPQVAGLVKLKDGSIMDVGVPNRNKSSIAAAEISEPMVPTIRAFFWPKFLAMIPMPSRDRTMVGIAASADWEP